MPHPFSSGANVTLTGNRTLTQAEIDEQTVWVIDPGGAGRNLVLPDASAANAGYVLFIKNSADAAEVITIQANSATVCTPTQNESAIVFSNGTIWGGIAGANS